MPATPSGIGVGLAMALEQVRAALSDPQRLLGIHFRAGGRGPDGGEAPEVVIRPPTCDTGAGHSGGVLVWQVRKQSSSSKRAGAGGGPFGRPEFLSVDETTARLKELMSQGPSSPARLVLAARTGGMLVEFAGRSVRRSSLTPHEAAALLAETGALRQRTPIPDPSPAQAAAPGSLLLPEEAGELLRAIGIAGPTGAVLRDERRKFNQINHLLDMLRGLLERMPISRELIIVDAGCGKSQLLLVLNYVLTEKMGRRARLIGLDTDPQAVDYARKLQNQVGYRNMEFAATPIRAWEPPQRVDLVLSLHACDTATDEALALGVAARAQGILAVPCCQHELAPQLRGPEGLAPLLAYPILRVRLGDWLTDGLRAMVLEAYGYKVDVLEYVSPLDTPKNILLRAERVASSTGSGAAGTAAAAGAQAVMDYFGVKPSLPGLIDSMLASRRTTAE